MDENEDQLIERLSAYTTVDKHALDDEFERHPQRLWEVVDTLAEAHASRSAAKLMLERTEAKARSAELSAWDGKPTEKALASAVALDADVRRRQAQLMAADETCERLQGLLGAMQAKTSALKHLSELCQAGYFVSNNGRKIRRRVDDDRG
jgi:hypothetical protein